MFISILGLEIYRGQSLSFALGRRARIMSSTVKPNEVQDVAARRIEKLRGLPFVEISALHDRVDEMESVRDREVTVATYRDHLPDGRIRVVVQAYYHRFLGIGTMTADGFIIASDGTRAPVPQEMMWEFI